MALAAPGSQPTKRPSIIRKAILSMGEIAALMMPGGSRCRIIIIGRAIIQLLRMEQVAPVRCANGAINGNHHPFANSAG